MSKKIQILLIVFATLLFSNCKKYNDGGNAINAKHHLFANGGVWFIDKYEVNGADSTICLSSVRELNKNELKFIFKRPIKFGPESSACATVSTKDYVAQFSFSRLKSNLQFYSQSFNCISNSAGHSRKFIFFPESKAGLWEIIKLTKDELILGCKTSRNTYLIQLNKS